MSKKRESFKEIELYPNYGLMEIRFWITQQTMVPELSDDIIKTFLHSCYYSIKDTKDTITSFFAIRLKTPGVFLNRNPELLQMAAGLSYVVKLPGLTKEGYEVVLLGLFHNDATEYVYKDILKLYLMCIELWAFKSKERYEGLVVVIDAKNFTFAHLRKMEFGTLKTGFQYFQDALPVRLKKIIIINVSNPVYVLLSMMQPVIAKRLVNLIEKYNRDSTEYFKTVPKKMFPIEYEGECKSIRNLQEDNVKQLYENKEWFKNDDEILSSIRAKQPRRSSIFEIFF